MSGPTRRMASDGCTRGPVWGYVLFADELEKRFAELADARRDFRIGVIRPCGLTTPDMLAAALGIQDALEELVVLLANLDRVTSASTPTRTFGGPGDPGDAVAIQHLASRVGEGYRSILDWAAKLRGTVVPERARSAYWELSCWAESILSKLEELVSEFATTIREVDTAIREGRPHASSATLNLEVAIDERAFDRAKAAMQAMFDSKWNAESIAPFGTERSAELLPRIMAELDNGVHAELGRMRQQELGR